MTALHILPHLIWRLRTATFSPAAAIQSERRSLLDPDLIIPVRGDGHGTLLATQLPPGGAGEIGAFLSPPWTTGSATPSGDPGLECSPQGGSSMTPRTGALTLSSRGWKVGMLPPPLGAGVLSHMVGISEETNDIFSTDDSRLIISRGLAVRVIVADTLISRCSSATCL